MNQLPSPLLNYVNRFIEQYEQLNLASINEEGLIELIESNKTALNNLFMAGLGASTLILRLGAVVQLCKKLEKGTPKEDTLLMKQIMDNLVDNLPSDTSWRMIWTVTTEKGSSWESGVLAKKGSQSLFESFITFRNKYVHGYISLKSDDAKKIANGLSVLHKMVCETSTLFYNSEIIEQNDRFFFVQGDKSVSLYPFLQKGEKDGLPYIFQGLYNNKSTAELISTFHGDTEKQKGTLHYEKVFKPISDALKSGAGQVFDHSNRIANYNSCFVGREKETTAILDWVLDKTAQNILPVFSNAGMGKGALLANVIQELSDSEINIPVLYHFCGSGIQNSLHATLYHFIIQGKKQQIWKTDNDEIIRKLNRLPSKYTDLIMLFHKLLDECFVPSRKNESGNLAIVLDGLDEAAVAFSQLHLSDWFDNYDENGDVIDSWESKSSIKWIFSYREGFYRFPKSDKNKFIDILQPLNGLSEAAVKDALLEFNPSQDFLNEVIIRGEVIE